MQIVTYLETLSNYELLVFYKYRHNELDNFQTIELNKAISSRNISINDYSNYKQKQAETKGFKCPRCLTSKLMKISKDSEQKGLSYIFLNLKYSISSFKNEYECELCHYRFKHWMTIKQIIKLIE